MHERSLVRALLKQLHELAALYADERVNSAQRMLKPALGTVCGERFRIERNNFRCNRCGSYQISLQGGEELLLESVTMEDMEP